MLIDHSFLHVCVLSLSVSLAREQALFCDLTHKRWSRERERRPRLYRLLCTRTKRAPARSLLFPWMPTPTLLSQAFHKELTPLQSDVTAVNQKGTMLSEQCRPEDSDLITAQLEEVNSRWDDLCLHSSERQQTIEGALLQLGQFQLALEELLVWVKQTNATLDEQLARNVQGDVKFIEVEKAKHKVSFTFWLLKVIDNVNGRVIRRSYV